MNNINFTQPTGFPLEAEGLGFMQNTYIKGLTALARMGGNDNVILTGLIDNGSTVTDGWVLFQNELFFFEGGIKTPTFFINEVITTLNNASGNPVNRYYERKLQFGVSSNSYSFDLLKRIQSLQNLEFKLSTCFFEGNVIIAGCDVISYDVINSTVNISAGFVKVGDAFHQVAGYNGAYPIWIDSTGVFTQNSTSPEDILFNPKTSQRLADVYKRAITPLGEIIMRAILSDDFDDTGLGINGLLGWALCNGQNNTVDLRGRTVMGYDERVNDPNNNVWDSIYSTVGNVGGEKNHVLTIEEMPSHNHTNQTTDAGFNDVSQGQHGLIRRSANGENNTVSSPDVSGSGNEPDIVRSPVDVPFQGENFPHENRPPFVVVAFLQRI
jgi:microcystin-dependent protein